MVYSHFKSMMKYSRSLFWLAVVFALPSPAVGQVSMDFTVSIPSEYERECRMDRDVLSARTIAANTDVYPEHVARTDDGWLVYDRYDKEVVELDDSLAEVDRWGRQGRGPLEYVNVVAMVRTGADQVVVFEVAPPSMVVFGKDEGEHRLDVSPRHAVFDLGRLLMVDRAGDVFEVTPKTGEMQLIHHRADWKIPVPKGDGARPIARLRPGGYVGFLGPSTIWTASPSPKLLVQRCVHEDWAAVHTTAPMLDLGGPIGVQPYTINTMQDFAVLPSGGFLALGGLSVDREHIRSIERYDEDGGLVSAWRLDGFPRASGVFDNKSPGRLLIWEEQEIDGIVLVEFPEDLLSAR